MGSRVNEDKKGWGRASEKPGAHAGASGGYNGCFWGLMRMTSVSEAAAVRDNNASVCHFGGREVSADGEI